MASIHDLSKKINIRSLPQSELITTPPVSVIIFKSKSFWSRPSKIKSFFKSFSLFVVYPDKQSDESEDDLSYF